jgi:hypothetical protein
MIIVGYSWLLLAVGGLFEGDSEEREMEASSNAPKRRVVPLHRALGGTSIDELSVTVASVLSVCI